MKRPWVPGVVVVLIAVLGLSTLAWAFLPIPVGLRHLLHLAMPPRDLYAPVALGQFPVWETGTTQTFVLRPKYLDIYEIGFLIEREALPSEYRFRGKLLVEFSFDGKLLAQRTVDSAAALWSKDSPGIDRVSLFTFDVPFMGRYAKGLTLRLTVLDGDAQLLARKDSVRLYVAVSGIP